MEGEASEETLLGFLSLLFEMLSDSARPRARVPLAPPPAFPRSSTMAAPWVWGSRVYGFLLGDPKHHDLAPNLGLHWYFFAEVRAGTPPLAPLSFLFLSRSRA